MIVYKDDWEKLKESIRDSSHFGWDNETNSLNCRTAATLGASFGWKEGIEYKACYVPINHRVLLKTVFNLCSKGEDPYTHIYEKVENQVELEDYVRFMHELFMDRSKTIYVHNFSYDGLLLYFLFEKFGLQADCLAKVLDTQLSSWLLCRTSFKLKVRVLEELSYQMSTLDDVLDEYDKALESDINEMGAYAADDAVWCLRLGEHHGIELLDMDPRLHKLWHELECEIAKVLVHMEFVGMGISKETLANIDASFKIEQDRLYKELVGLLGVTINLNSSEEISRLLFDTLGWWDGEALQQLLAAKRVDFKRSAKGLYGTGKEVIEDLVHYNLCSKNGAKAAKLLLEYKKYATQRNTFCKGYIGLIDDDGRIRSHLSQCFTKTGRFNSKRPNLQNVSNRDPVSRKIRKAFIPGEGWTIVDPDYSQIELRILAHVTQDKHMLDTFRNNRDPHQDTADALGIARAFAKTVNFLTVYGGGAGKLSRALKVSLGKAKSFMSGYKAHYRGVTKFKAKQVKLVHERGYVTTLLGRRRYFHKEIADGTYWENMACNTPIQGGSADLLKVALRNIYQWLQNDGLLFTKVKIIMQVHDEILFEVRDDFVEEFEKRVKYEMENALALSIETIVEPESGKSWYEAH